MVTLVHMIIHAVWSPCAHMARLLRLVRRPRGGHTKFCLQVACPHPTSMGCNLVFLRSYRMVTLVHMIIHVVWSHLRAHGEVSALVRWPRWGAQDILFADRMATSDGHVMQACSRPAIVWSPRCI